MCHSAYGTVPKGHFPFFCFCDDLSESEWKSMELTLKLWITSSVTIPLPLLISRVWKHLLQLHHPPSHVFVKWHKTWSLVHVCCVSMRHSRLICNIHLHYNSFTITDDSFNTLLMNMWLTEITPHYLCLNEDKYYMLNHVDWGKRLGLAWWDVPKRELFLCFYQWLL